MSRRSSTDRADRECALDDRESCPAQRTALVRSTSASHAFARDELAPEAHLGALTALADQLGARLRTAGDTCRGLTLIVRLADRSTLTRSRTVPEPTGPSSGHPVHLRLRGADHVGQVAGVRQIGSSPPERRGTDPRPHGAADPRLLTARAESSRQSGASRTCGGCALHSSRSATPGGFLYRKVRGTICAHTGTPLNQGPRPEDEGLRARAGMASSIPPVFRRPDGHGGVEG
ncbi:hypothetical protein [Streptomyces bauhiniae]|uniref:DinB/UmuC family translesion DNA polymerase n=1 Tax=Streptomyces bauhiniae TaxID=2340725 RepID=UPI001EF1DCA8|nr:hypothetical protein [Streptomyces bauhiniae]